MLEMPRAALVNQIEFLQAEPDRLEDFIHNGTLEVSLNGQQWETIGNIASQEERFPIDPPQAMRFVRVTVSSDQESRLVLREFRIHTGALVDISMAPSKLIAGSLGNLVNGDLLDVCTFITGLDKGTRILVDLGETRNIDAVFIYQDIRDHYDSFSVETSTEGQNWDYHAVSRGAVTQARFEPTETRFIRIGALRSQKEAFKIHEILFRDAPQE